MFCSALPAESSNMDFVKRYISPKEYPHLLLTCKEYRDTFKTMEGSLMLQRLLEEDLWLENIDVVKDLTSLESIRFLIETLEPKGVRFKDRGVIYKPLTWHMALIIRKNARLNHLNLLGF